MIERIKDSCEAKLSDIAFRGDVLSLDAIVSVIRQIHEQKPDVEMVVFRMDTENLREYIDPAEDHDHIDLGQE